VPCGETHSVKRHLDVDAESYDAQIRQFIPLHDDMLTTGVEVHGALPAREGAVDPAPQQTTRASIVSSS
jgi:hypothetical protein